MITERRPDLRVLAELVEIDGEATPGEGEQSYDLTPGTDLKDAPLFFGGPVSADDEGQDFLADVLEQARELDVPEFTPRWSSWFEGAWGTTPAQLAAVHELAQQVVRQCGGVVYSPEDDAVIVDPTAHLASYEDHQATVREAMLPIVGRDITDPSSPMRVELRGPDGGESAMSEFTRLQQSVRAEEPPGAGHDDEDDEDATPHGRWGDMRRVEALRQKRWALIMLPLVILGAAGRSWRFHHRLAEIEHAQHAHVASLQTDQSTNHEGRVSPSRAGSAAKDAAEPCPPIGNPMAKPTTGPLAAVAHGGVERYYPLDGPDQPAGTLKDWAIRWCSIEAGDSYSAVFEAVGEPNTDIGTYSVWTKDGVRFFLQFDDDGNVYARSGLSTNDIAARATSSDGCSSAAAPIAVRDDHLWRKKYASYPAFIHGADYTPEGSAPKRTGGPTDAAFHDAWCTIKRGETFAQVYASLGVPNLSIGSYSVWEVSGQRYFLQFDPASGRAVAWSD